MPVILTRMVPHPPEAQDSSRNPGQESGGVGLPGGGSGASDHPDGLETNLPLTRLQRLNRPFAFIFHLVQFKILLPS